jgi:hypothetical protein
MRPLAAALLLVCSLAAHAGGDALVFGHVRKDGREIEIYNGTTHCKFVRELRGAVDAAIYQIGQRAPYKMGCVRALSGDRFLMLVDGTGEAITFSRRDIVTSSGGFSL